MAERVYECSIPGCSKAYTCKFNLKRHMDAFHSEEGKLECHICHRLLSSRQSLREHVFTHSGDTPYVCKEPGCNQKFRQGSQLSVHKRIHKTIRGVARFSDFKPLEVSSIQLTKLLEGNPDALDYQQASERKSVLKEFRALALITSKSCTELLNHQD